ncbi:KilA-N domain-containing protein, partial [Belnapia sp. T18]
MTITYTPTSGTGSLCYEGRIIRQRGSMLNLTDMWKAARAPENQRPSDWLALDETGRFRAYAGAQATGIDPGMAENTSQDGILAQYGIHPTQLDGATADNAGQDGILDCDSDGLVATLRGRLGGTWAHWQLALAYARYLSPQFHLWCNVVVRSAMEHLDGPEAGEDPLLRHILQQFRALHRRLDTVDRHAADLMFLLLSSQDLLLGKRRHFSDRSQAVIRAVVAAEPHEGQCPCCDRNPVISGDGQPLAGAEFDHFFHRGLNRPEHGWLICGPCHTELTRGGYLVRFMRM